MVTHVVQQGECLSGIARRYGFANYRALYDHPANAELREKRPNPNVLQPGDEVVIPTRDGRPEPVATTRTHVFQLKVPRKALRLRLCAVDGSPFAKTPYELDLDGELREGMTDGDGRLEEKVPPGARRATLTVADYLVELHLGHLNPLRGRDANDLSGVQARLRNLGYDPGPVDGRFGRRTRAALAVFQADHSLEVDGEPSDATAAKLEEAHGC